MRLKYAVGLAGCTLLLGCPPTTPPPREGLAHEHPNYLGRLAWTVHSQSQDGGAGFFPIAVVDGGVTLDPTIPFDVLLEASSPDGISSVTVSGQANGVVCQARYDAQVQNTNPLSFSFDPQTVTKYPPVNLVVVGYFFPLTSGPLMAEKPTDVGVIGCGVGAWSYTPIRVFDAWRGPLIFTGNATIGTTSFAEPARLTVNLKPPNG